MEHSLEVFTSLKMRFSHKFNQSDVCGQEFVQIVLIRSKCSPFDGSGAGPKLLCSVQRFRTSLFTRRQTRLRTRENFTVNPLRR